MTIIAAADGSALGNPGPAGWAWYIDAERWRCGGWERGTNNQGELTAVLDLLRQTAHIGEELLICCDSQYVINSVTKWMSGWKRKGWKKADGKPVLNVEIMKALDEAMRGRSVRFQWVKGHAGHELNEKADALANGAAQAHASRDEPDAGPGFPGAPAVGAGDDPAAPPAAGRASGAGTGSGASEPDLFSADSPGAGAGSTGPQQTAVDLVVDLDRALLSGTVGGDQAETGALLHPAWRQVTAAGELRTRADGFAATGAASDATGFELVEARELAAEVVLVLRRDASAQGSILHSSVWVRSDGDWRQAFHQATREV